MYGAEGCENQQRKHLFLCIIDRLPPKLSMTGNAEDATTASNIVEKWFF